ncbi:LOW QUALITY PROTEIN: hypothetical protein SETIT_6G161500v2 [Setaria italica]|uniref:Uncharacterized protein n=1 Tax=Setaria italica TaxID=4555 RepID=A0A368RM17_SETIT|nr:LOW QUALITY PROTEIN: hypothetical protein SETIT_6G161500v2 [Setaria italica]
MAQLLPLGLGSGGVRAAGGRRRPRGASGAEAGGGRAARRRAGGSGGGGREQPTAREEEQGDPAGGREIQRAGDPAGGERREGGRRAGERAAGGRERRRAAGGRRKRRQAVVTGERREKGERGERMREDEEEWAAAEIEVVATVHAAEHRCSVVVTRFSGRGHSMLVTDDETGPKAVVQRASMSAIHCHPSFMGFERHRQRGDGGGSGGGHETFALEVAEEAEQGRCAVERAVAVEEGGVGEEPAPGLADERDADEARRVVWREAEEDLAEDVVDQLRRPRHGVLGDSTASRQQAVRMDGEGADPKGAGQRRSGGHGPRRAFESGGRGPTSVRERAPLSGSGRHRPRQPGGAGGAGVELGSSRELVGGGPRAGPGCGWGGARGEGMARVAGHALARPRP